MATRSMIFVLSPNSGVHQYYRHWDGYLSCAGVDLMQKMLTAFTEYLIEKPGCGGYDECFLRVMDRDLRLPGEYDKNYEFEEEFCVHVDAEWVYAVDLRGPRMKLFYWNCGICESLNSDRYADAEALCLRVIRECNSVFTIMAE